MSGGYQFSSESDAVTSVNDWRSAFVTDLQSHALIDSAEQSVFPKELIALIASYCAPDFSTVLRVITAKALASVHPRVESFSGSGCYQFQWNCAPFVPAEWPAAQTWLANASENTTRVCSEDDYPPAMFLTKLSDFLPNRLKCGEHSPEVGRVVGAVRDLMDAGATDGGGAGEYGRLRIIARSPFESQTMYHSLTCYWLTLDTPTATHATTSAGAVSAPPTLYLEFRYTHRSNG